MFTHPGGGVAEPAISSRNDTIRVDRVEQCIKEFHLGHAPVVDVHCTRCAGAGASAVAGAAAAGGLNVVRELDPVVREAGAQNPVHWRWVAAGHAAVRPRNLVEEIPVRIAAAACRRDLPRLQPAVSISRVAIVEGFAGSVHVALLRAHLEITGARPVHGKVRNIASAAVPIRELSVAVDARRSCSVHSSHTRPDVPNPVNISIESSRFSS